MYPWESAVRDYIQAWDVKENRPKDLGLMQEFYNNVLGKSFEIRGRKISYRQIMHAKRDYHFGEVPNHFAKDYCGSKILLLTCAVDVHKDNLAVAVFGWTKGSRCFLIDYWRFEGDTSQESDPGTWGRLAELIEGEGYLADDGTQYNFALTLVDSGYLPAQVYNFCESYEAGVYALKGRETATKNSAIKEFSKFSSKQGTPVYGVTVNFYKDRMSASMLIDWAGTDEQKPRCLNFPDDISEGQLKELTAEQKREKINRITKQREGFEWYRSGGVKNELWDLLIYNAAALDIIAVDTCDVYLKLDAVSWPSFWEYIEENKLFFVGV
jgi:phage terminase large subunit GpA-like protein